MKGKNLPGGNTIVKQKEFLRCLVVISVYNFLVYLTDLYLSDPTTCPSRAFFSPEKYMWVIVCSCMLDCGESVLCKREVLLNYSSAIFSKSREGFISTCFRIRVVPPGDFWALQTSTRFDYKVLPCLSAGIEGTIVTCFGEQCLW